MAKRLKYTKEILTHMLNGTTPPTNADSNRDQQLSSTGTGWNSNN